MSCGASFTLISVFTLEEIKKEIKKLKKYTVYLNKFSKKCHFYWFGKGYSRSNNVSRALKTALFLSVSLCSPPPSEAALLQHVQGRRGQTDPDSGHRVDRQRRAGQLHFTVSAACLSAHFL